MTAQGDHSEQDLQHLLHHVDLPPQLILPLFTVSVHSDVETLVKLERTENGQLLERFCEEKSERDRNPDL